MPVNGFGQPLNGGDALVESARRRVCDGECHRLDLVPLDGPFGDARSCTIGVLSQIHEAVGIEKLRGGCAGGDPYARVIESKRSWLRRPARAEVARSLLGSISRCSGP